MTAQSGNVIMEGRVTIESGIISVNVRLVIRVGSNKLKTFHPLKFIRAVRLSKLVGILLPYFFLKKSTFMGSAILLELVLRIEERHIAKVASPSLYLYMWRLVKSLLFR